jgi:hypothetical protein
MLDFPLCSSSSPIHLLQQLKPAAPPPSGRFVSRSTSLVDELQRNSDPAHTDWDEEPSGLKRVGLVAAKDSSPEDQLIARSSWDQHPWASLG